MLVLVRRIVDIVECPRLARHREFVVPFAVNPDGVGVADALHPEREDRFEADLVAGAVGHRGHRDRGPCDHAIAGRERHLVFEIAHVLHRRVLDPGKLIG